jgi:hypothetical protein
MTTKLTTLPFSGFYQSRHDALIDRAVEGVFRDDDGEPNGGLACALTMDCNFGPVFELYARYYARAFADEFKITTLKFESLRSPREYNFDTDVIYAHVDLDELRAILAKTDDSVMSDVCAERHTSCSGFVSFYSPDWRSWGDLSEWDHNQVGSLLIAYANQEAGGWRDFGQEAEESLMEGTAGGGQLENWIIEASPNFKRFERIHDYLKARAAREEVTA